MTTPDGKPVPGTDDAIRASIETALLTEQWGMGHAMLAEHARHRHHGACGICRGDVTAITAVAMTALQPHLGAIDALGRGAETAEARLAHRHGEWQRELDARITAEQNAIDATERAEQAEATLAEAKAAFEHAIASTAADAMTHRLCGLTLHGALRRAEQAEATLAEVKAALATFDGRGINSFDIPAPGEVLDAWRNALDPKDTP